MTAAGRFVGALAFGLLAGVPIFVGLLAESWVIAQVTGWDLAVVFAVQAVPVAVFGVIGVVFHAGQVARRGWDHVR